MAHTPIEINATLAASGSTNDSAADVHEINTDGALVQTVVQSGGPVQFYVDVRADDRFPWDDYFELDELAGGETQTYPTDVGDVGELRLRAVNQSGDDAEILGVVRTAP